MNLSDIRTAPWALTPTKFAEVLAIYERHERGETADLEAIAARIGKPLANTRQPLTVDANGVAHISVDGVTGRRMNALQDISGGTSTQVLSSEIARAVADENITGIILHIDSPGGEVAGMQELAGQVFAARGTKPIEALVDGMCCSAAYWLASACDAIRLSSDSTAVGSIGVIGSHTDTSGAEAARGVRTTTVASGPLKGAPSPHAPLDATGRSVLQAAVDHHHGIFAGDVSKHRGLEGDRLKAVTDGRVLYGKAAVDAGLADSVGDRVPAMVERFRRSSSIAQKRPRSDVVIRDPAPPRSVGDISTAAAALVAREARAGRHLQVAQAIALVTSGQGI